MQRTRKAIARLLAVLAVIAAFIAIFVVVMNGMTSNDDSGSSGNQPGKQAQNPNGKTKQKVKKVPKTYTVKEGDTLGAIAARYGLKGATILRLNPGVDAQSLAVGAKLKLR